MPDSEFYSPGNLQGACREHNLAKGTADRMARVNGEDPPPRRSRTIFEGHHR
jgi:hypothetical protein